MTILKTPEEIEIMAEAGKMLAGVLAKLKTEIKPGMATSEIDKMAHDLIVATGSKPAFLNYQPAGADKAFPATACVSVNETVVHGLPSDYELKEGDLVTVDLGLIHKKYYSDSAFTVGVGKISEEAESLIKTTRQSLELAIKEAIPGNTLGDIGYAVESYVKKNGFHVIRGLTGHGIGRGLHEDPYVWNYGQPGKGDELVPGMVLAIEPMVASTEKVKRMKDDSYVTADKSLSAHFEHTVAITPEGPRVLTEIRI